MAGVDSTTTIMKTGVIVVGEERVVGRANFHPRLDGSVSGQILNHARLPSLATDNGALIKES